MALIENRLEQLERTLLELGTEVFKSRNEISSLKEYHEKFVKIVDGLRKILDDKGVISVEDFDSAIELGEVLKEPENTYDHSLDFHLEKLKKASH